MENRVQILRHRRPAASRRWHSETVYAVTDLSWQQIRADQLADAFREHWHVENRPHWIRDVTGTGGGIGADIADAATGQGGPDGWRQQGTTTASAPVSSTGHLGQTR
jgi:hypothetical protein